jgi:hypothetical protein
VLVVLGSTAAAAANGSLPDGAQSAVSKALSHVSVDVPDPRSSAPVSDHPAVDHHGAVGPDTTGAAHRGLCTAWAARGKADSDRGASGDSTAFSALRRAAHDDGQLVKDFCADVLDGATTAHDATPSGTDDGPSVTDHKQSGTDHGRVEPPAPVDAPDGGGVGTASDTNGGANANGAGHASDAPTLGSANTDAHRGAGTTPRTTGSSHSGR